MKAIKLTYALAGVLALTMISTGCQKRPNNVTPLKDRTTQIRPGDPYAGTPVSFDSTGVSSEPGGGAQPTTYDDIDKFNQDREMFRADTVHFDYDSSVIKSSEMSHLDAVASYMKNNPSVGLLVEGHCDERGTEDYNNSLGERRATAVREALIQAGVDSSHVVTRSFGEYKPIAMGHDESAYAQNRRGEFVVLHPK